MAGLDIWTVYDHPSDMPDAFVVRRHVATAEGSVPTGDALSSPSLAAIRRALANKGLTCIPRDPADEPHIVECWI